MTIKDFGTTISKVTSTSSKGAYFCIEMGITPSNNNILMEEHYRRSVMQQADSEFRVDINPDGKYGGGIRDDLSCPASFAVIEFNARCGCRLLQIERIFPIPIYHARVR